MAGRGRGSLDPLKQPQAVGDRTVALAGAEAEGVVLRMHVPDGHWAEEIPPVPRSFTVTVSFGSEALADEHRDALELLGYRVVDRPVPADGSLPDAAHFLVTGDVIGQHPTYWRSLAEHGARAYHLALGPAAAAVADVVALHAPLLGR